jgi:phospholipid-transporting ATPase
MAGRPPPGQVPAANNQHDDLLLDLDDSRPVYNSGSRPTANDDELLARYNRDHADADGHRPSVSYDNFVGGSGHPPGAGPSIAPSTAPYAHPDGRQFSQTSELGNWHRYTDTDGYSDTNSTNGYYASGGGDDTAAESNGGAVRNVQNRNSILSLGGGLVGKAKHMFGMGPQYSEMDLPLTEAGAARAAPASVDGATNPKAHKRKKSGFKFSFGRGAPDPSTLGPRIIHLNNPPANGANKYVDNHISTAKYNIATFIPKFLYEQFSKYANVFFLFTAILQQIPDISPTNRYTTIVPLFIVLMVSAIKEIVEDFRRKQSDQGLNHSKARVLRGSSFQDTRWIKVAVGDIVRVESEEPFPADLILLASSEPEGLCYIETANLDGETNLKIKQAIPETAHLVSHSELSRLGGRIRSEQPNSSLYTYEGTLTMQAGGGEKELPLAPDQLLLRGATLRNTPWIHGVVVFTGHETKLMRNATGTPIKKTAVERMLNRQILMLGAILISLSIISSIGDVIVRAKAAKNLWYLDLGPFNGAKQFFSDILTYWVLYSNLVPISLFVTVEIVKYAQAFLIDSDLDIYYDKTDTPANCRTSSLVES